MKLFLSYYSTEISYIPIKNGNELHIKLKPCHKIVYFIVCRIKFVCFALFLQQTWEVSDGWLVMDDRHFCHFRSGYLRSGWQFFFLAKIIISIYDLEFPFSKKFHSLFVLIFEQFHILFCVDKLISIMRQIVWFRNDNRNANIWTNSAFIVCEFKMEYYSPINK